MDQTDAAQLAAYREVIERAARDDPQARSAAAAIFAALDRRDWQWRELMAIAQAVAADIMVEYPGAHQATCVFDCTGMLGTRNEFDHSLDCPVTRARALLAR
jgi:hypothetical protein